MTILQKIGKAVTPFLKVSVGVDSQYPETYDPRRKPRFKRNLLVVSLLLSTLVGLSTMAEAKAPAKKAAAKPKAAQTRVVTVPWLENGEKPTKRDREIQYLIKKIKWSNLPDPATRAEQDVKAFAKAMTFDQPDWMLASEIFNCAAATYLPGDDETKWDNDGWDIYKDTVDIMLLGDDESTYYFKFAGLILEGQKG